MIELEFENTNSARWPLKARSKNFEFIFSGSFNPARIQNENLRNLLGFCSKVLFWAILLLGIGGLFTSSYFCWLLKDPLFLIRPSVFNIAFYFGIFAALYLWSQKKEKEISQYSPNLAGWESLGGLKNGVRVDIFELFSESAKKVWGNSLNMAKKRRDDLKKLNPKFNLRINPEVTANDLALSLLNDKNIGMVFLRLGVDIDEIKKLVKKYSLINSEEPKETLAKIPFAAFTESLKLHNKTVDPLMLLCALAQNLPKEHFLQAMFFNIDLTADKLEIISSWIFNLKILSDDLKIFHKLSKFKPDNEINKGLTSVPTYYLDQFSRDLTHMAKRGALPLALGRGADLHEIFKILSSGSRNLLVKGEAGTGRTTLVNELAYKMATEQVPKIWQDKRLVSLEISAILGQPQKCEQIFIQCLNEAEKSGNIILVIEDAHSLARASSQNGLSLLELLVDFLQNYNLMAIATTGLEDYVDYLKPCANFDQVFTSYELSPLSKEGIMLACCVRASLLEGQNQCLFLYQAIEEAVKLTDLFMKGEGQPQKAISVLVEAANRAKNSSNKVVSPGEIQKIVSEKTHIPSQTLSQNEEEKLLNLETELSKYIVGQNAAVTAIAEGLRRARSGLSSQARPLASFLFLGPTGVGKTEIARVLAKKYFGEEHYLIRLDMSEFQGPEGIIKLLGSPERKIDPPLIKHLKNYPFCLLLLDEFEKASSEIINLFLQILEDGRLTSGQGEVLDMTHCLIIATSNAGSKQIQAGLKEHKTFEQIKQQLFSLTLTATFPPELLNRFDAIILFSSLDTEQIKQIAILQLQDLKQKLFEKGIKAEFSDNVVSDIAQNAFDPSLGARPIRRYIQDHLEGFVAKLILGKQLPRGANITIDLVDGQLTVK
jgi:ATP-dependent Clp protease ATP-binding subunit ClpA